jgi:hypothetical protein
MAFLKRLGKNEHNLSARRFFNNQFFNNNNSFNFLTPNGDTDPNKVFFLNIPFVSDDIECKVKRVVNELGVKVVISHKGSQLKHIVKGRIHDTNCNLPNCKPKSPLCLFKGSVYLIKCSACESSYIGSSWRHLHTRYSEHITRRASPIYRPYWS